MSLSIQCSLSTAQQQVNNNLTAKLPLKILTSPGVCSVADDLRAIARNEVYSEIRRLISNLSIQLPAGSCREIFPNAPSGYYDIVATNGTITRVYCGVLPQCCNDPTGWTQVAFINMTNSSYQCPSAFREISTPKRVCGRTNTSSGSCDGVIFSVNGMQYNKVCGRIVAYQIGTPAAFHENLLGRVGLESFYLEGISITYGNPRQHIWSFAATPGESYTTSSSDPSLCPCSNPAVTYSTPTFVGNDYFCESGSVDQPCCPKGIFFANNTLFDGHDCGPASSCCSHNSPPWFCKTLPESTMDDLEVRICSDQGTQTDDIPFEILEIYIK